MEVEWVVAAGFVTWLMTVLGWLFVNRQANAREARKEYRAAVTSLEVDADGLLEAYRLYLTVQEEAEREQARLEVHSELNRLRRHVSALAIDVGPHLEEAFSAIFETVTGGSFESRQRAPERAPEEYALSVAASDELVDIAEAWFREKYLGVTLFQRIGLRLQRWWRESL